MPTAPSRRTFLHLCGVVAVSQAGCLGNGDQQDLTMFNNAEREVTVTTTIDRVDGEERVFADTMTMRKDGRRYYRNPIREAATYLIEVSVESGPSNSYEWDAPSDESYGLTVRIGGDEVSFGELVS